MFPRRVASVAAVLGGLTWLVKVVLIWIADGDTDSIQVAVTYFGGLGLLGVALAAAGYTLVEKAPVWLRAVVTVATPLLVLMVWQLFDQAVKALYTTEGWLQGELSVIVAAAFGLTLGLWGFTRHPPDADTGDAPAHVRTGRGRRAAR